jgi:L-arabinose transport system substrate-binding protein
MLNRKLSLLLAALMIVSMILSACGSTEPAPAPAAPAAEATKAPEAPAAEAAKPVDGKVTIAYLNKMGDNPWFVDEVAGAKAVADELGVEFFNQDLQFDSNLAMTAMDTYIGKGISGIIIVVPDTKIGPAVIEKAQAAGIPLIAVDDTILDGSGKAAPFVGFDAASAGLKVGELIAEYYQAEGWDKLTGAKIKAVSVEDQDLEVCNLRTEGATKKLTELGIITDADIIHLPYDNTANSGMDAMGPVITANPDVTHWLLYSCNDDGVLGAWRALQNSGVDAKNVIGVGINGQLAAEEFKKGEPTGLRASLMAQAKEHGGQAVRFIYENVTAGKPIPDVTFIPAAVMTMDNWAELTGQEAESKPADTGKKVSIAYLNKMGDNPWFVDEVAGAKAVADELGVEFFNQDLQFDSNLAMTAMDTYIGKGISGIIIVVPDTKIGPAVIEKAQAAGIPLIAVDDTILDGSGKAAPFVGFDAASAGLKVGELIAEYYQAEGWDKLTGAKIKAVSVEDQDLEVCNLRTEGATKKLTELGIITDADIIHLPYDNTANSGMDAMGPVITANPDVTHWLLYSCNDDGVLGAWRALQNSGVDAKNVIGVGINGQLAAEEFKKGEPTGLRASLMAQAKEHGGQAVRFIYENVTAGKPIPDVTFIPAAVMTMDNWAELTGQK